MDSNSSGEKRKAIENLRKRDHIGRYERAGTHPVRSVARWFESRSGKNGQSTSIEASL